MRDNGSVKDLQPELDDSWLKRACNLPSAGSHVALRAADVPRQVEVRVVEEVVELGSKLNPQSLYRSNELLVHRQIRLVECRAASGVAVRIAERALRHAAHADGRQRERGWIDVVYVSRVRSPTLRPQGDRLTWYTVRTILIRSAVGSRNL